MNGRVEDHHALLPVTFRFTSFPDQTIEFVVDTGFVGELTLPLADIETMGLHYINDIEVNLANDTVVRVPVYAATIHWQDDERDVRVLATGRRPLLGMMLLDSCELLVQCVDGGLMTVESI